MGEGDKRRCQKRTLTGEYGVRVWYVRSTGGKYKVTESFESEEKSGIEKLCKSKLGWCYMQESLAFLQS